LHQLRRHVRCRWVQLWVHLHLSRHLSWLLIASLRHHLRLSCPLLLLADLLRSSWNLVRLLGLLRSVPGLRCLIHACLRSVSLRCLLLGSHREVALKWLRLRVVRLLRLLVLLRRIHRCLRSILWSLLLHRSSLWVAWLLVTLSDGLLLLLLLRLVATERRLSKRLPLSSITLHLLLLAHDERGIEDRKFHLGLLSIFPSKMFIVDLLLFSVDSWVDWIHQTKCVFVVLLTLEKVVLAGIFEDLSSFLLGSTRF